MKKTLVAACVAALMSTSTVMADTTKLTSEDDRLSYSLGMLIGERILKQYSEDINYYVMLEGIRAAHAGTETLLTMDEAQQVMQASEDNAAQASIAEAKESGAAYMAENAKKEDTPKDVKRQRNAEALDSFYNSKPIKPKKRKNKKKPSV